LEGARMEELTRLAFPENVKEAVRRIVEGEEDAKRNNYKDWIRNFYNSAELSMERINEIGEALKIWNLDSVIQKCGDVNVDLLDYPEIPGVPEETLANMKRKMQLDIKKKNLGRLKEWLMNNRSKKVGQGMPEGFEMIDGEVAYYHHARAIFAYNYALYILEKSYKEASRQSYEVDLERSLAKDLGIDEEAYELYRKRA